MKLTSDAMVDIDANALAQHAMFVFNEYGEITDSHIPEDVNSDEVYDGIILSNVDKIYSEGDGVTLQGSFIVQRHIRTIHGGYYDEPESITEDASVEFSIHYQFGDVGRAWGAFDVY